MQELLNVPHFKLKKKKKMENKMKETTQIQKEIFKRKLRLKEKFYTPQ